MRSTICFLLLLSFHVCAQKKITEPTSESFHLAIHFYASENYYHATTEFYRAIFFDSANCVSDRAYYRIGLCERQLGNQEKSDSALNEAARITQNDSLRECILLAEATNAILSGNFPLADIKLLKLLHSTNYEQTKNEANTLLLISAVLQHNWSRAQDIADKDSALQSNQRVKMKLDSIFQSALSHSTKSASKARTLSTLLPGAGQLYAQDYKNAANAFLLNAMNVTLNTMLFLNGYYIDGLLYFITFTERYYNGNRYQAAQRVLKSERLYEDQIQEILLETISKF